MLLRSVLEGERGRGYLVLDFVTVLYIYCKFYLQYLLQCIYIFRQNVDYYM